MLLEGSYIIVHSSFGSCNNYMQSHDTWFRDSSSFLDTWYHLTTVLSGQTGLIYVNGTMTAQNTTMTPPTNTVKTDCLIGYGWSNVVIDEVKFYNRALLEAEIQQDYLLNGPLAWGAISKKSKYQKRRKKQFVFIFSCLYCSFSIKTHFKSSAHFLLSLRLSHSKENFVFFFSFFLS